METMLVVQFHTIKKAYLAIFKPFHFFVNEKEYNCFQNTFPCYEIIWNASFVHAHRSKMERNDELKFSNSK